MIPPETVSKAAEAVAATLPDGYGFAIVITPWSDNGVGPDGKPVTTQFVTNSQRHDAWDMLRNFVLATVKDPTYNRCAK